MGRFYGKKKYRIFFITTIATVAAQRSRPAGGKYTQGPPTESHHDFAFFLFTWTFLFFTFLFFRSDIKLGKKNIYLFIYRKNAKLFWARSTCCCMSHTEREREREREREIVYIYVTGTELNS
jgi:hypothetical protein